jgi:hypothetical protein
VTAILSSTLFPPAQSSDLKHKQFDLALQEKHVHILEGYVINIHSRHTLSSDFRTETHKKLFAQATLGYVTGAKKLCIFTAGTLISKSSNMKQKQYDLDVQGTHVLNQRAT